MADLPKWRKFGRPPACSLRRFGRWPELNGRFSEAPFSFVAHMTPSKRALLQGLDLFSPKRAISYIETCGPLDVLHFI
jgi:hypothetical protein